MRDSRRPSSFHGYREQSQPRYRAPRAGRAATVGFAGMIFIIAILIFIALAVVGVLGYTHHTTATCAVTDKSVGYDKDGNGIYRIYTANCGVLAIQDNPLFGNFNSADIYGAIRPGHTYRLETVGYRNGFFSWFPNIIDEQPA